MCFVTIRGAQGGFCGLEHSAQDERIWGLGEKQDSIDLFEDRSSGYYRRQSSPSLAACNAAEFRATGVTAAEQRASRQLLSLLGGLPSYMWHSHCVPCLLGEPLQRTAIVLHLEVSCMLDASRTTCRCLGCWQCCTGTHAIMPCFWSLTSALQAGFASYISVCLTIDIGWRCVQHQHEVCRTPFCSGMCLSPCRHDMLTMRFAG